MGKNKIHAVLDTNVIVSAFISDNINSNPTIIKHFPQKPFVVTPAEMVEILNM